MQRDDCRDGMWMDGWVILGNDSRDINTFVAFVLFVVGGKEWLITEEC